MREESSKRGEADGVVPCSPVSACLVESLLARLVPRMISVVRDGTSSL
jgi:hypothetical protein